MRVDSTTQSFVKYGLTCIILSVLGPSNIIFQTCPGKCAENKACVECIGFATGPYTKEECEALCGHVRVYHVIDEDRVKSMLSHKMANLQIICFGLLRSVRIFRVLKVKRLIKPSSKHCFSVWLKSNSHAPKIHTCKYTPVCKFYSGY